MAHHRFLPETSCERGNKYLDRAVLVPTVEHTDEMVRQVDHAMLSLGRMEKGEYVTIVAGSPPGTPGSTNALRVWRLGDPLPSSSG